MTYDVAVIGGGAAGLAAARSARAEGASVAFVQDGPPGGDCTFTGCIPSKTLLAEGARGAGFASAMSRVRANVARVAATESSAVLRSEGIEVVDARATLRSANRVDVGDGVLDAERIVLATGTEPTVPPLPGIDEIDPLVPESLFALTAPPSSVAVVGAGSTGCELAQALARLGVEVTLVEEASRVLSGEVETVSTVVGDALVRDGVRVMTGAGVEKIEPNELGGGVRVHLDPGEPLDVERVLLAVGRTPATDSLGLDAAGVAVDDQGWIVVDDRMRTTAAGVFAAGDVTGLAPFTHAADEMGRVATANALHRFHWRRFDAGRVPYTVFTDPEVARVGVSEHDSPPGSRVAELPLDRVDRAITDGSEEGFLQLVVAPRRLLRRVAGGRLVGATVVAPRAGEILAPIVLALRAGMFPARLAVTTQAYPTWTTALQQVAAQLLTEFDGVRARPARRRAPGEGGG